MRHWIGQSIRWGRNFTYWDFHFPWFMNLLLDLKSQHTVIHLITKVVIILAKGVMQFPQFPLHTWYDALIAAYNSYSSSAKTTYRNQTHSLVLTHFVFHIVINPFSSRYMHLKVACYRSISLYAAVYSFYFFHWIKHGYRQVFYSNIKGRGAVGSCRPDLRHFMFINSEPT